MMNIQSIKLSNQFNNYVNSDNNPLESLEPISKINIFVGPNNSGKSRFMRILASQKKYLANISGINLETINLRVAELLGKIITDMNTYRFLEVNGLNVMKIEEISKLPKQLDLMTDSYDGIRNALRNWSNFPPINSWSGGGQPQYKSLIEDSIKANTKEALKLIEEIPIASEKTMPERVYIPIIRGLRPLDDDHSDYYSNRTINDYFSNEESSPPEVYSGQTFYIRLKQMLLGNLNERKKIQDYQNFLTNVFFEGQQITLIPNENIKAVVVKIGKEKEQPIFHLGDGIQSAIVLTFLPFIMEEPSFFFIEEPEMYMHPGLQRKLLYFFDTLDRHYFFFTTHSNHFLDITIDISNSTIYTFNKTLSIDEHEEEQTPKFIVESVDRSDSSSLALLGVRNSSVFLVNATIWVEGITDRWYFRKMIESYLETNPNLKIIEEDVHYSFVEYGGANITHWSFLDEYEDKPIEITRLCAKAIVIIDTDGNSKLERKEKLLEELGDRLIVIPGREIENLLPYEVLAKVILEFEKTPERVLPQFSQSVYKDKKLGAFIENSVLEKITAREGGYMENSGTIKSKRVFCEKACPLIEFDSLSEETKKMIVKIYNFIIEQNS